MTLHVVTYDLRKPGRNYDGLIDHLQSYAGWWHCLESMWFVESTLTAAELRDKIRTFVDANDGVLVMDVRTRSWATLGLSNQCNTWLKENL